MRPQSFVIFTMEMTTYENITIAYLIKKTKKKKKTSVTQMAVC